MPTVIQSDKLASAHLGAAAVFGLEVPAFLSGYTFGSAHSLRQVRQAYTGPALRVRNNTNNAEGDVAFAGFAVRSTSVVTITAAGSSGYSLGQTMTLATFAGAADVRVTTWYDQSGNGRNAINTTAAQQPALMVAGAFILEGGLPVIACDGTDDRLIATWNRPQPHSIVVAARAQTAGTNDLIGGYKYPAGGSACSIAMNGGPNRHIYAGTVLAGSGSDFGLRRVWGARFNGASSKMYADAVEIASGNAGTDYAMDLRFGANNSNTLHNGKYHECLLVENATEDLVLLSQKVMAYYGLL